MTQDGIIWVASYPKSGNTWIRCLIVSLMAGGAAPDMRELGRLCPNGAARNWLEEVQDVATEDMSPAELAWLRAAVYRQFAARDGGPRFLKLHDRYDPELIPPEATAGTIYVVRDPRDVAPSWAAHMNVSLDRALDRMAMPGFTLARFPDQYNPQTEQHLESWSGHVSSWLDGVAADRPLLLIRYEDLLSDPMTWVGRLARFIGLPADDDTVGRAVQACRFEALQEAETKQGFIERPDSLDRFFRQGRAGAWRHVLSPEQRSRIEARHGEMMTRQGYPVGE